MILHFKMICSKVLFLFSFVLLLNAIGCKKQEKVDQKVIMPGKSKMLLAIQKKLRSSDPKIRMKGLEKVRGLRTKAILFLPELQKTLLDKNAGIRRETCWILEAIGPKARVLIPSLFKVLPNTPLADRVLTAILPKSDKSLKLLLTAMKHKDLKVKKFAAWELRKYRAKAAPALPQLIQALKSKNDDLVQAAAFTIGQIGVKAISAVPALLRVVNKHPNASVRNYLLHPLGILGKWDKSALRPMFKRMRSFDIKIAYQGVTNIYYSGGNAAPAIPHLITLLMTLSHRRMPRRSGPGWSCGVDEGDDVRNERALAKFTNKKPFVNLSEGITELRFLRAKDPDAHLPSIAVALGRIGPKAIPALLSTGRHGHPVVERKVISAFGYMGAKVNNKALAFVFEGFKKGGHGRRKEAAWALSKIGQKAIPGLLKLLKHQQPVIRASVAHILGTIGPKARRASSVLLQTLEDKKVKVRRNAAWALGKIQVKETRIFKALAKRLSDPHLDVALHAATALGQLGPKASLTTPSLIKALQYKKWKVEKYAIWALGQLKPKNSAVVSHLFQIVKKGPQVLRLDASRALSKLRAHSNKSIPLLLQLLKTPQKPSKTSHLREVELEGPDSHSSAVLTLGLMGSKSLKVQSTLLKTAKSKNWLLKALSIWALGQQGNKAYAVRKVIQHACKDTDRTVRRTAEKALQTLGFLQGCWLAQN